MFSDCAKCGKGIEVQDSEATRPVHLCPKCLEVERHEYLAALYQLLERKLIVLEDS